MIRKFNTGLCSRKAYAILELAFTALTRGHSTLLFFVKHDDGKFSLQNASFFSYGPATSRINHVVREADGSISIATNLSSYDAYCCHATKNKNHGLCFTKRKLCNLLNDLKLKLKWVVPSDAEFYVTSNAQKTLACSSSMNDAEIQDFINGWEDDGMFLCWNKESSGAYVNDHEFPYFSSCGIYGLEKPFTLKTSDIDDVIQALKTDSECGMKNDAMLTEFISSLMKKCADDIKKLCEDVSYSIAFNENARAKEIALKLANGCYHNDCLDQVNSDIDAVRRVVGSIKQAWEQVKAFCRCMTLHQFVFWSVYEHLVKKAM